MTPVNYSSKSGKLVEAHGNESAPEQFILIGRSFLVCMRPGRIASANRDGRQALAIRPYWMSEHMLPQTCSPVQFINRPRWRNLQSLSRILEPQSWPTCKWWFQSPAYELAQIDIVTAVVEDARDESERRCTDGAGLGGHRTRLLTIQCGSGKCGRTTSAMHRIDPRQRRAKSHNSDGE
ncbi:hypothetical protein BX600DRAFT_34441 [Xylariales sp. PMI_506]|nr:hypothetical protein BX600DRAFT_34441 [Xylariales sp. PMI_506]